MPRIRRGFSLLMALTLVLSWSLVAGAQEGDGPSVTVGDQIVRDGIVVVEQVVAAQDGWIVIHSGADGIGPVIGQTFVNEGVNEMVEVEIDASAGTPNLYAMLHVDEGVAGTYEFPGPDGPVVVDGEVVAPIFAVIYVGRVTPQPVAEEGEGEEGEGEEGEGEEGEGEEGEGEGDEAPQNIVATAMAAGNFETLIAAVQAAGLVDALAEGEELTVFAPTDEAFAALPEGALDGLLADPEGALTDILLYHVVPTVALAADLSDGMTIETLQGGLLTVSIGEDGTVMINDATVIAADVMASNGVIHVIDSVLMPPDMMAASDEAMDDETMDDEAMSENIVATAMAAGNFETLIAAAQAAGLADALAEGDGLTVFAPTDEAFAALPDGALDGLLADPEGALRDVLLYHVVPMAAMASDLSDGMTLETLQGGSLTVSISDDGTVMIDEATVVAADIAASNGVIHVIDSVLMPSDMMAMDDEAMDDEAMDDEAMDDEAMDDEAMDEAPDMLPVTGGSAQSNSTLPLAAGFALLALAGGAFAVIRRRQTS